MSASRSPTHPPRRILRINTIPRKNIRPVPIEVPIEAANATTAAHKAAGAAETVVETVAVVAAGAGAVDEIAADARKAAREVATCLLPSTPRLKAASSARKIPAVLSRAVNSPAVLSRAVQSNAALIIAVRKALARPDRRLLAMLPKNRSCFPANRSRSIATSPLPPPPRRLSNKKLMSQSPKWKKSRLAPQVLSPLARRLERMFPAALPVDSHVGFSRKPALKRIPRQPAPKNSPEPPKTLRLQFEKHPRHKPMLPPNPPASKLP